MILCLTKSYLRAVRANNDISLTSLCFRYDIVTNCWDDDPNLRPSFEKLREELKEMEDQHKVDLWS